MGRQSGQFKDEGFGSTQVLPEKLSGRLSGRA
jgi:hypothetical protein